MQTKRKLLIGVLLMGLILAPIAKASEECKGYCDGVIHACDVALDAKSKQIDLCQLGLTQAIEQKQSVSRELESTKQELQSPTRNPFIMIAVGTVIGMLVTGFAVRR